VLEISLKKAEVCNFQTLAPPIWLYLLITKL